MKVGIVGCSDGIAKETFPGLKKDLKNVLESIGIEPVFSPFIEARRGFFSGTDEERAKALMDFYENPEIAEIFDMSGGDLANGILPFLDYETIKKSDKRYWGYSDLTTVLNAVYTKTGKANNLYSIKNILFDKSGKQLSNLESYLLGKNQNLFLPEIKFLRGEKMEGELIGGNIRCFLKLAGTEYFPETAGKVLFLEACGGNEAKIATFMSQLKQMRVFEKVNGVIFGTFTEYLKEKTRKELNEFLLSYLPETLPVGVTEEIGHGVDSKALVIGGKFLA